VCAILGVVSPYAIRYSADVAKGLASMQHRGPDASDTVAHEDCIMGHNRLTLVDASTGNQPMRSQCGQYTITFNGEIYSYKEIKRKLKPFYSFTTNSDTEVVLALYILKNISMLSELDGMFSFAIWDNKNKTLFAARDRFGEKPFYYSFIDVNTFVFASEIKAFYSFTDFAPKISQTSLTRYLQRMYVPANACIYENVGQLAPGNYLIKSGKSLKTDSYWSLPEIDENISTFEVMEHSSFLLRKAVKKCLTADFPVGAFLSGGIDSTFVTSTALETNVALTTFGMTVDVGSEDDLLTRYFVGNSKHNHFQIDMPLLSLDNMLAELMRVYDEPFADSSGILTSILCRFARGHVKAVLTGDGGDELYGGYSFWYHPLLRSSDNNREHLELDRFNFISAHLMQTAVFSNEAIVAFGLKSTDDALNDEVSTYSRSQSLDDILRYDTREYLPGDILKKVDMAAMANGLESRAPFLDIEHADFMLKVSWRNKLNNLTDKIPLRKLLSERFPLIATRKKQGFGGPLHNWLTRDSSQETIRHYLLSAGSPIYSCLDVGRFRARLNPLQVWTLLVLSCWLEKHS
jgi:asparagine synthase (glutamine-hydrolysing)